MSWWFGKSLELVAKVLYQAKDEQQLGQLLEDLMTTQEIEDCAERVRLMQLLREGKTQRDIAEELGISITTVNRGSRVLKQ